MLPFYFSFLVILSQRIPGRACPSFPRPPPPLQSPESGRPAATTAFLDLVLVGDFDLNTIPQLNESGGDSFGAADIDKGAIAILTPGEEEVKVEESPGGCTCGETCWSMNGVLHAI